MITFRTNPIRRWTISGWVFASRSRRPVRSRRHSVRCPSTGCAATWGIGVMRPMMRAKMSSIKKTIMKQGMKLMSDPRVMRLMQDERVMKAVMQMMSVPGKVQGFTNEQVEKLAKAMSLATEDEVKDLKRQIRRLEEEVARLEKKNKT